MNLDQNLTLFETNKLILSELRNISIQLRQGVVYQQQAHEHLREIHCLLHGFTNSGASLSGYMPDAFTNAYLSVLGPVLAKRLDDNQLDLEELMKGATLLSRHLLEELAAYRTVQEGRDVIEDALSLVEDPWKQQSENEDEQF
mgnify:CR=1 FL=1